MTQEPTRPHKPRESVIAYFNARDRGRDRIIDGLQHVLRILDSGRPETEMAARIVVDEMLAELRGDA